MVSSLIRRLVWVRSLLSWWFPSPVKVLPSYLSHTRVYILSIYCLYTFICHIIYRSSTKGCFYVFVLFCIVFLCVFQVVMGNFLSDAESGAGLKWSIWSKWERRSWTWLPGPCLEVMWNRPRTTTGSMHLGRCSWVGFWFWNIPGLVNVYITMVKITILNGKIHYKWSFRWIWMVGSCCTVHICAPRPWTQHMGSTGCCSSVRQMHTSPGKRGGSFQVKKFKGSYDDPMMILCQYSSQMFTVRMFTVNGLEQLFWWFPMLLFLKMPFWYWICMTGMPCWSVLCVMT